MSDTKPHRPKCEERIYLERCIANITQTLKGPLTNTERVFLVADRKDMRIRLLDLGDAHD